MPRKRSPSSDRPAKSSSRSERASKFHAVAIHAGENACPAALDVKGDRVLSQEAPKLPLDHCDRPARCACRYRHFDDRRAQPRRQVDGAPPSAAPPQQDNRRDAQGRRAEDYPDYDPDDAAQVDDLEDTYFGYRRKTR